MNSFRPCVQLATHEETCENLDFSSKHLWTLNWMNNENCDSTTEYWEHEVSVMQTEIILSETTRHQKNTKKTQPEKTPIVAAEFLKDTNV